MMHLPLWRRRRLLAFTLVELLVVIGIIALLAGLAGPSFNMAMQKAQSVKCSANLHSIGVAVTQAATDNNNTYPEINQTAPPLPYDASVQGLVGVLGPYGISTNSIQCPMDISSSPSAFKMYGSSYEWRPAYDDESINATVLYINPGMAIPVSSSKIRLCNDFNNIHRGKANCLYGDGHVSIH